MTDAAPESLNAQFAALDAERARSWDPEKLRRNLAQREALVAAFDPTAVVQAGDVVAPFALETATGAPLTLDDLVTDGPAVLLFFRFAGCPACNIALPYYDRQLRPALAAAGVPLVAVSPHLPETGLDAIRADHDLGLIVAADRGNTLARRFGLAFEPHDNPPVPENDAGWIGALTGLGTWELPQPAVVVIDRDRTVRFAEVSPDWLRRTEAPAVLAAVAGLRTAIAA